MNTLLYQISITEISLNPFAETTQKSYSSCYLMALPSQEVFATSTSVNTNYNVDEKVIPEIHKLNSFLQLPDNWDSYGAQPPSKAAVERAIHFILKLVQKDQLPFFIAPSPNGDILIELRTNNVSYEFTFSKDGCRYEELSLIG